ncbi:MAG: CopG family transcriptional regulator [Thermodesulfobacteriota bacterium]
MVRTVIGLDPEDKQWLDDKAREEHVPMAEIVRRAVRRLRSESELGLECFDRVLRDTSGVWEGEDGLAYQRRLRDEWETPR